jgi:hypothetical protein
MERGASQHRQGVLAKMVGHGKRGRKNASNFTIYSFRQLGNQASIFFTQPYGLLQLPSVKKLR